MYRAWCGFNVQPMQLYQPGDIVLTVCLFTPPPSLYRLKSMVSHIVLTVCPPPRPPVSGCLLPPCVLYHHRSMLTRTGSSRWCPATVNSSTSPSTCR